MGMDSERSKLILPRPPCCPEQPRPAEPVGAEEAELLPWLSRRPLPSSSLLPQNPESSVKESGGEDSRPSPPRFFTAVGHLLFGAVELWAHIDSPSCSRKKNEE